MRIRPEEKMRLRIFLTVFLVYLFYIAPGYTSALTNRYIFLTKSIVEDGTFCIDKYQASTRDVAFYNGHYYIGAAPGLSLMASGLYIILKPFLAVIPPAIYRGLEPEILNFFFALFFSALPGAVISLFMYDILQHLGIGKKYALLTVFASAFGTILFYYSTRFTHHVMGTLVLLSAFYIIFRSRIFGCNRALCFLAGISLGMAPLLDYTLAIGSVLIFIYAVISIKRGKIAPYFFMILGISLPALLYIYYHYTCFGSPFVSAASHSRMIGPVALRLPKLNILYELTFGTYRGLFMYMPILLVSIYGIVAFFRRPEKKYLAEITLLSAYSLLTFFIVAVFCSTVWPLGGDFGPRYLISVVPFLMIAAAFAHRHIRYNLIFWIAALSILINWCGVQYGDADNPFTNIFLFILMGLNSNMAEWLYKFADTYMRHFNVVARFSPFVVFMGLAIVIYLIWKRELDDFMRAHLAGQA